jgi:uncharacterized protein YyaL (SSP411 family)
LQFLLIGVKEIVVLGEHYKEQAKEILEEYIPLKLLQAALNTHDSWPLLKGKVASERTKIYLCENYQCLQPVTSLIELKTQITKTFLTKNPHKQNN